MAFAGSRKRHDRRHRTEMDHPFRTMGGLSFEMEQKAVTKLLPNALSRFT
jgi:hypothetical protein